MSASPDPFLAAHAMAAHVRSAARVSASLDAVLAQAKSRLDSLTGANQLTALAQTVVQRDEAFSAARVLLHERKATFDSALAKRAEVQQELTSLVQVRAATTPIVLYSSEPELRFRVGPHRGNPAGRPRT